MATIISAKTSGVGGLEVTGDASGVLQLASNNGTTGAELDASQLFKFNSGYGSVATAYGCRAWVNFNGTGTVAIRASGNVSSITDNGTGDYTVNLTNAMPDVNYSVNITGARVPGSYNSIGVINNSNPTYSTTATRFWMIQTNDSLLDSAYVNVVFMR